MLCDLHGCRLAHFFEKLKDIEVITFEKHTKVYLVAVKLQWSEVSRRILLGSNMCQANLAAANQSLAFSSWDLTLSNPIFLPTAYSPALIYHGWERGWWITCWLKSVIHEEKCRTGSYSGAGEQTQKKKCRTGSYSGAGKQTQKKKVSDVTRHRSRMGRS